MAVNRNKIDFSKTGTVHDFIGDCYENIRRYCYQRETNLYKTHWEDRAQEIVYLLIRYCPEQGEKKYSIWFYWVTKFYVKSYYAKESSKAIRVESSEEFSFEESLSIEFGAYSTEERSEFSEKLVRFMELYPDLYGLAERILVDGAPAAAVIERYRADKNKKTSETYLTQWNVHILPEIREILQRL